MNRTNGLSGKLSRSFLLPLVAAMSLHSANACVGGATETIDVTWQAFSSAAVGSETIGGMTINSDGSSAFTADQVAAVAVGGSVTGLSVGSPASGWNVAVGNGSTDTFFTSTTTFTAGVATPTDAGATGSGAAPTFAETTAGAWQACKFIVTAPATATQGAFNFTVTAVDNAPTPNTATTYAGTVHFSYSSNMWPFNTGLTLPADSTLTNGTGTFQALVQGTDRSYTITATDTVDGSVTGNATVAVPNPNYSSVNTTPGATLLFPYFEVDSTSSTGRDTMMTLQNNSATAMLNHVTVWTDLGMPVLTFNIYLTGYDIESIDMYDVLVNGNLPKTASAGQDWTDQVSPKGMFSQDINFASCNGELAYPTPSLTAGYIADLTAALSGHPAVFLNGRCSGFNHGDAILRGYVTIDTVNNCTHSNPGDPGYFFPGGSGSATNQNVMSGEYFLVDAGHALLHSDTAVALHATANDPNFNTPGNYTFYGRVDSPAWSAADNRQPLPNTWAVDAQSAGTELIVWRDTKTTPTTFVCSNPVPPSKGLPLGQETAFSFNNQEQPLAIPAGTPFGLATQRVALGTAAFPLPAKPGWVYLGLGYTNPTAPVPPVDQAADEAYVSVLQYPESHATSTGTGAIALDSGQAPLHSHPNP